jgi:RecB family exonuclease
MKLLTEEFKGAVSPTRIQSFQLCPRKWWYSEIQKLPQKESPGKALGTKCHKELEEYMLGKRSFKELSPVAASSFPFLDTLGAVYTEYAIEFKTAKGVTVTGTIDLVDLDNHRIIDHKFRKDLKKYGAKKEKLLEDEQAILYSHWAAENFEWDTVEFVINEHSTVEPYRSNQVAVQFSRQELLERAARLFDIVDERMLPFAELSEAKAEGTPTKPCYAFGGCDYNKHCVYSPKFEGGTVGIFKLGSDKPIKPTTPPLLPPEAPSREYVEPPNSVPTPPSKKKPKPKRAKGAPVEQAELLTNEEQTVEPTIETVTLPEAPEVATPAGLQVLYIECYTNAGAYDLSQLVHSVAREIAEKANAPDLRLAAGKEFEFGKWRAVLSREVVERVQSQGIQRAYIARGDLNDAVIEGLCAIAGEVVRVMR